MNFSSLFVISIFAFILYIVGLVHSYFFHKEKFNDFVYCGLFSLALLIISVIIFYSSLFVTATLFFVIYLIGLIRSYFSDRNKFYDLIYCGLFIIILSTILAGIIFVNDIK